MSRPERAAQISSARAMAALAQRSWSWPGAGNIVRLRLGEEAFIFINSSASDRESRKNSVSQICCTATKIGAGYNPIQGARMLKGKSVLITGTTSEIGLAIACALALDGGVAQ